jgi:bacillopeptidase F
MAGRGVYRKRRERRVSRLYLLIVFVFGFVVIKWGIPLLIELIAKSGGDSTQTVDAGDIIPPQTPMVSALPEATNSASLRIEGYTEAGVMVEYYVNDIPVIDEQTDDDGFFEASLSLEEGENEIKVVAKDEAENESTSKLFNVIYDFKNPEISLSSPTDGQEFFGQQQQSVTVSGEVSEPEANLKINNTYVRLGNSGSFELKISLSEGENEIKLMAVDPAGNVVEEAIKVSYVR